MKDTFIPSIKTWKKWVILDAKDQTLGRLASQISKILIGKLKTNYTPFLDTGDNVIIINAEKIVVTGKKEKQNMQIIHEKKEASMFSPKITTKTHTKILFFFLDSFYTFRVIFRIFS
jgi:large subunit ribosomal protein L13